MLRNFVFALVALTTIALAAPFAQAQPAPFLGGITVEYLTVPLRAYDPRSLAELGQAANLFQEGAATIWSNLLVRCTYHDYGVTDRGHSYTLTDGVDYPKPPREAVALIHFPITMAGDEATDWMRYHGLEPCDLRDLLTFKIEQPGFFSEGRRVVALGRPTYAATDEVVAAQFCFFIGNDGQDDYLQTRFAKSAVRYGKQFYFLARPAQR